MLNYIRAELWKAFRRRYFWVATLLLLAGAVYSTTTIWVPAGENLTDNLVDLLLALLPLVGLFMVLVIEDASFQDQYRYGTLKNEVVYGIPRARIYLGKEFAAALLGMLCAGVVLGIYLLLSAVLPGAAEGEALARALSAALFQILCALPLWLGALGLAHFFYMLFPSGVGAAIAYVLFLTVGGSAVELVYVNTVPGTAARDAVELIRLGTLLGPFELLRPMTGVPRYLAYAWAVGMGWFWGCTAVGILGFRLRDIR